MKNYFYVICFMISAMIGIELGIVLMDWMIQNTDWKFWYRAGGYLWLTIAGYLFIKHQDLYKIKQ